MPDLFIFECIICGQKFGPAPFEPGEAKLFRHLRDEHDSEPVKVTNQETGEVTHFKGGKP